MSLRKIYANYSESETTDTSFSEGIYYRAGDVGRDRSTPREYLRSEVTQQADAINSTIRNRLRLRTDYSNWVGSVWSQNDLNIHHNRLVGKIREAVGPQSSLGSSIFAEGGEAVSMMVNSLTEIASIAKAIRKKDISRLKKAWKSPRRVQEAMAEAGGRWLQFSWGWKPLVSTVADTLDVLAQDPSPKQITVKTRMSGAETYRKVSGEKRIDNYAGTMSSKVSYNVTITNGNIWLLNSLELLNPAIWVWEAIPFSWLADYFVQVGDVIGSLNQFAGVKLDFRYHSVVVDMKCERRLFNTSNGALLGTNNATFYDFHRIVNQPLDLGIKLTYNVSNPLTSSLSRGMNICSFLATRLK